MERCAKVPASLGLIGCHSRFGACAAIWAGSAIYSIENLAVFALITSPILYAVVYSLRNAFLLAFIVTNTLCWMLHAYILNGWPSLVLTACGKSFSTVGRFPTAGRFLYLLSYGTVGAVPAV